MEARTPQSLLIVFCVLFPIVFNPFAETVNTAYLLTKMIFLVLWNIVAVIYIIKAKLHLKTKTPGAFLVLFLLTSLVSTIINGDLEQKLLNPARFDGWFSWLNYVLLFYNASCLSQKIAFRKMLALWPFVALPAAIILLLQGYFGTPAWLEHLVYEGGFPGGTFGNRAGFSGYATLLVVPGLMWASRAGFSGLIGLGIFGWAIGLAQTRGAWIGILAGIVAMLIYFPRRKLLRNTFVLGIGFSLALLLPLPSLKTHFASPDSGRLILWRVAAQAILERPLFGWGVGGFSEAFARLADWRHDQKIRSFLLPKNDPDLRSADLSDDPFPITRVLVYGDAKNQRIVKQNAEIDKAHNEYIDLFLSFGLFPFLFWLLFLFQTMKKLLRSHQTPELFLFSVISMCIFNIFWMDSITFFPYFWFMAGFFSQNLQSRDSAQSHKEMNINLIT